MVRPAFTLVEILIVIVIVGLVASLTIRSGLTTQQQAVFQTNFQEVVLMAQDVRSKALANADDANKGYGMQLEIDTQRLRSFIDKNGDGTYLVETDEELSVIDLTKKIDFEMAATAYRLQEDIEDFDANLDEVVTDSITVYFPSNKLNCQLIAKEGGINARLGFMEATFGNENRNQLLSVHHLGCIPEVSRESLLNS